MDGRKFQAKLTYFLGFVKYIRDSNYHGEILVTRENGITTPKRENCSNDNLKLVNDAIGKLRKLERTNSSAEIRRKILVYTKHQTQFVGQCLLDRIWAKHEAMKKFVENRYSWDSLSTQSQKKFVSSMIRHENVIMTTMNVLFSVLRLRSSNDNDALYVLKNIRKMVLAKGFYSPIYKKQLEELPFIWDRVRRHYKHLIKSNKWNILITSLRNARVNVGRPDSFSMHQHRVRMQGLVHRSTHGI
jgi:hypothetical protein